MTVTAAQVKELRERTGSGMMECKKALIETGGDIESAIEWMRKQGLAKADRKAGRVAAEGIITTAMSDDGSRAAMVEINSETDFVSKNDDFRRFAIAIAEKILAAHPTTLDELLSMPLDPDKKSINEVRQILIAKIGENINVRRFTCVEAKNGRIGCYIHGDRIGVLVAIEGGSDELAKDLAMHITASKPQAITSEGISTEVLDKEREILIAQAKDSGKSAEIIEKMVEGRLQKFLSEVTLLGQSFVKDPDTKVSELLKIAGANVSRFERFEVGEGVEKKIGNFAEEVRLQLQGG
ncbi:translation elongation factor Ts [Candidatus Nitrosoglobus terrae]|uniref:Elongation factor Ts n=1 Tax=Candidatus Nitrosoglobus terrae TaxID=1630141 RepID=A0A1Q2SLT1_9GAMM|nr:translation elongation factor Ts [Candidatus Nitrosoglobus terrae]BAW80082.1 translation elongation factor Ts [Candidatus Nitrosoglobus terrae]